MDKSPIFQTNSDSDSSLAGAGGTSDGCLLMFSGGRDSTLAAIRLSHLFSRLRLVTIAGEHLVGVEHVRNRLLEMRGMLPHQTSWMLVKQPAISFSEPLNQRTCLPCQQSYAVVGALLAKQFAFSNLAFGYARYQSDWPEQSQVAVQELRSVLTGAGISLHLPAYDLESKGHAVSELRRLGLTGDSMEQKCLKQVTNIALPADALKSEVALWTKGIADALRSPNTMRPLEVLCEEPC